MAADIDRERRKQTALGDVVAVSRGQVSAKQCRQRPIGAAFEPPAPFRRRFRQKNADDLRLELALGAEMPVEAAMRQPGGLHDVGEADAVETLLAEQRCRQSRMRSRLSANFARLTLIETTPASPSLDRSI